MDTFTQSHLTGVAALSAEEIDTILERAQYYADQLADASYRSDLLKGKTILSLFFEDSTRTRVSFEMAARRLGADWVNIDIDRSSVNKGESFLDTIQTLLAITQPHGIVVRHKEYGAPDFIAAHAPCPVINAGDSWREHPTQALLDALTIKQHKGTLKDLRIAICGDIAHSRVAASNMILLTKMGGDVRVIAPEALMPDKLAAEGVTKFHSLEDGLPGCDIVMMLRLQKERMEQSAIPSEAAYFNEYGLTQDKLALAKPDALVMHPGPMNRGVEIADDVADDPHRSLILKQVANGVPVRMAVMDLLLNKP